VADADDLSRQAWSIQVRGTVQGVGFRPFVYRVAAGLGLDGSVRNVGGDVLIEAAGSAGALDALTRALRSAAPTNAVVRQVAVTPALTVPPVGAGFAVLGSDGRAAPASLSGLPADIATCDECLRELFDPADRRFRYPFGNCTDCGPRATIIDELPYDRVRTAMAGFGLCVACSAEYHDPANRRFHAEPIACPECGPRLEWVPPSPTGTGPPSGDWPAAAAGAGALAAAVDIIAGGGIVAVKGVGGYQLVGDATNASTVDLLRTRKRRPRKPFAVMVADLAAVGRLARPEPAEAALLTNPARPIVLLAAHADGALAPGVHPGTDQVGIFLPYTPLHHLLLRELARPLVVTSGNLADEPIAIADRDAQTRLGPVADGILRHDRPIRARYDDSVVRAVGGTGVMVRRARGYAPRPLTLPVPAVRPVLAVGAHLKHTFTLAAGDRAVVGPHTGSLDDADVLAAFHETLGQLTRLHRFTPAVVAHDLHPGYLSTRYALDQVGAARRVAVQHHHAHVVSCAAEHGLRGQFLGVAYDGLGLGDDGTLWGGEVLLASYTGYVRLARFARAPLPGGEAAVRRSARMALGYLFGGESTVGADAGPFVNRLDPHETGVVRRMIERGVNSPPTSSAGRLFDAVASLLGVCDEASYEGEAAVMLEALAATQPGPVAALPWRIVETDGLWVYDWGPTLAAVLAGVAAGEPVARLAAAFHHTIVAVTVELCARAAQRTGVAQVCLSGGCLQNRILATGLLAALATAGLVGHLNREVPPNDGGISFGQAVVAAARDQQAHDQRAYDEEEG
jgi:hydrogenase maturation protein HypF